MQATILLAHGARNDDWARPFREIRDRLSALRPGTAVELAYLEFMEPTFLDACARLAGAGASRIVVCPLFLGTAGHVARDLPGLVDAARARWPGMTIDCTTTLGEDRQLLEAIAESCARHLPDPCGTDGTLHDRS